MADEHEDVGQPERVEGPTPAGGAYALAYFYDDARNSVPKEQSTGMEIQEFDDDGRMIHRTYLEKLPA